METPGFNAYQLAHEPWVFTDRTGKAHAARPISAPEASQFLLRFQLAGNDPEKFERAVSMLVRKLFPWRPGYLWSGDAYGRFMQLEPGPRAQALNDFFVHAGWQIQLQVLPTPRTPTTPRPSSSRGSATSTATRMNRSAAPIAP